MNQPKRPQVLLAYDTALLFFVQLEYNELTDEPMYVLTQMSKAVHSKKSSDNTLISTTILKTMATPIGVATMVNKLNELGLDIVAADFMAAVI